MDRFIANLTKMPNCSKIILKVLTDLTIFQVRFYSKKKVWNSFHFLNYEIIFNRKHNLKNNDLDWEHLIELCAQQTSKVYKKVE